MRRLFRSNGLSLVFLALFLAALIAQSIAGWADQAEELAAHGRPAIGYIAYISSSAFAVDVAENWQSEFLQFFLYILATVWLVQKGSPESKAPAEAGLGDAATQRIGPFADSESPRWARSRGVRLWLLSNSLLLVMGAVFLGSWFAQSLTGQVVANDENREHGLPPLTWLDYVCSPEFWSRTLQNWQSEFLAVGAMVVFSVYLRQRGSSQSKPVGAAHMATGEK